MSLGTITPEEISGKELVHLVCIKDFDEDFKLEYEERYEPFMKEGWETWTERMFADCTSDKLLIVESNHYEINFPSENFIIIGTFNKLKQ